MCCDACTHNKTYAKPGSGCEHCLGAPVAPLVQVHVPHPHVERVPDRPRNGGSHGRSGGRIREGEAWEKEFTTVTVCKRYSRTVDKWSMGPPATVSGDHATRPTVFSRWCLVTGFRKNDKSTDPIRPVSESHPNQTEHFWCATQHLAPFCLQCDPTAPGQTPFFLSSNLLV